MRFYLPCQRIRIKRKRSPAPAAPRPQQVSRARHGTDRSLLWHLGTFPAGSCGKSSDNAWCCKVTKQQNKDKPKTGRFRTIQFIQDHQKERFRRTIMLILVRIIIIVILVLYLKMLNRLQYLYCTVLLIDSIQGPQIRDHGHWLHVKIFDLHSL